MPDHKQSIADQMMAVAGISEEKYRLMQLDLGVEWLEMKTNPAEAKVHAQDPDFWSWWTLTWEIREKCILICIEKGIIGRSKAFTEWQQAHDIEKMVEQLPRFISRRIGRVKG